jgi:enoyl-CoA hydratase
LGGLQYLRWEIDGSVATVWLDRSPVNAVTQDMYGEIIELFTSTDSYLDGARAIVLTGTGKHFCGGNDLAEFQTLTPENSPARMKKIRESFWSIYDSPLPVIAAVRGVALGTGLAIAASCDLVIAGESARFGLPEIGVGIMGGAKHASRLVPQSVVRYLHLTAETMPAVELAKYGGVLDVVIDDLAVTRARELAAKMVRHSPVALRYAKQSLNHVEYLDLKRGYEYEQGLSSELSAYSDAKEAVNAFFEHREPQYTGT